jgi:hypothetical protein
MSDNPSVFYVIHRDGKPYANMQATGRRVYGTRKNAQIALSLLMNRIHEDEGIPAHELTAQFTVEQYTLVKGAKINDPNV